MVEENVFSFFTATYLKFNLKCRVCGQSAYEGHRSEHWQGSKARAPAWAVGPSIFGAEGQRLSETQGPSATQ